MSNDDNNSPKESKSFQDDDTVSKSTQNSLPWVLPDKYITDCLTIQLILSLLTLFSLFLPSTNMSLSEKCNVLFSLVTSNSPINRFSMLDFLPDVKIPMLHISLFSAESGQTLYRKVPCFANKVLEWYKHVFQIHNFLPFCRQSSVHSSANYIHCSIKLSVFISLFTVIYTQIFFACPIKLSSWAISFSTEDCQLNKIWLGTNVRLRTSFTHQCSRILVDD